MKAKNGALIKKKKKTKKCVRKTEPVVVAHSLDTAEGKNIKKDMHCTLDESILDL